MKKTVSLLLLTIFLAMNALLLSSCRLLQINGILGEEAAKITEMSEEIIRCLTEDDKEAFAELFCEKVRSRDGFGAEVDAVFDYFLCDVYTWAEIRDVASGGDSVELGERTDWYLSPIIPYIEVLVDQPDSDSVSRYYGIKYDWVLARSSDDTEVGLHFLNISLLNSDEEITVGTQEFFEEQ